MVVDLSWTRVVEKSAREKSWDGSWRGRFAVYAVEQQVFLDIAYQCLDRWWGELVGGTLRLQGVECVC